MLTVVLVQNRETSTITNSDGDSSSDRNILATVHVEGIVTICSDSSNIAVITRRSGSGSAGSAGRGGLIGSDSSSRPRLRCVVVLLVVVIVAVVAYVY